MKEVTLYLIVKKKWFDEIKSGRKDTEYREAKEYWRKRLTGKSFTHVQFKNGYAKDAPVLRRKIIAITRLSSGKDTDLEISVPVYAIHFRKEEDQIEKGK